MACSRISNKANVAGEETRGRMVGEKRGEQLELSG